MIRTALAVSTSTALCAACSVYGEDLLSEGAETATRDASANPSLPGGGTGQGGVGGGARSGGGGTGGRGGQAPVDPVGGAAGSAGSPGDPSPCGGSLDVPRRPDAPDASAPDAMADIVLATYSVDLGDRVSNAVTPPTSYRDIGLDIDETCTSVDSPLVARCILPSWAEGTVDGALGVDNAVGVFFQSVRDIAGVAFSSEQFTRQLQAGGTNLLYRIRGYNGQPNDDQVGVAVFVAAPFALGKDAGAEPRWDGADIWPVASQSLEAPTGSAPLESPKVVDAAAYVSDGRLVASFARLWVRIEIGVSLLSTSRLDMELSGARLVCDLVSVDAAGYQAQGCTLAGRWNANHLLKQLSHFSDPTSASGFDPVCTDDSLYTSFKDRICTNIDVAGAGSDESAPCDALSVGLHFSARPVQMGDVETLDPIEDRCPAETEPRADCCETLAQGVTSCP